MEGLIGVIKIDFQQIFAGDKMDMACKNIIHYVNRFRVVAAW